MGTYTVTVEFGGFQKAVTTGVAVDVATDKRVDVVLKPGAISNVVTVAGEDIRSGYDRGHAGRNVDARDGEEFAGERARLHEADYLTPGVAGVAGPDFGFAGSYGLFRMNGARGRSNNFLLDGTDMNDGYRNDPAINEAGVFGTPATILPIDAVSELKVLSNFEAEYGRSAGAVINIVTKSGRTGFTAMRSIISGTTRWMRGTISIRRGRRRRRFTTTSTELRWRTDH